MPSPAFTNPSGFTATTTISPTVPGTADEYELNFARRALARVKARLGPQAIETLLAPDIAAANTFWRETLAANTPSQEYKPARVELAFTGIAAAEFLNWFRHHCQKDATYMLAAQPEHWVVASDAAGNEKVIENLGEWVSRFGITFAEPAHPCQLADVYEDYPIRLSGYGRADDGLVSGYVLHQFRPHEGGAVVGFDANLCVYFPASAPEALFEAHRQHLVVEFTNWARHCYEDLHGAPLGKDF
ncbi:hypothetical protein CBS76997_1781 [Aspergillus niger]|nr:hypothetical protein CBS13152_4644 [Aspergillus niger]KAI3051193.1 hypothetical protein CBS76997_1781 [Aspergillus niger]